MRTLLLLALAAGCDVLTLPMAAPSEVPATATAATRLTLVPDHGAPIDGIRVRVALAAHVRPTRGEVGTATLAGTMPIRALAASSSLETLPVVIVEAETARTVDLYFPLPTGTSALVVDWPLSTDTGPYTLHASLTVDDDVAADPPAEHWWFAPGYAWTTFRHGDGVITREPPRSATVREIAAVDDCGRW